MKPFEVTIERRRLKALTTSRDRVISVIPKSFRATGLASQMSPASDDSVILLVHVTGKKERKKDRMKERKKERERERKTHVRHLQVMKPQSSVDNHSNRQPIKQIDGKRHGKRQTERKTSFVSMETSGCHCLWKCR